MNIRARLPVRSAPTILASALILAGCSSLNPSPVEEQLVRDRAAADRVTMFDRQEPIAAPITLDEAIARAVKYNLDMRLKKMEVAVSAQLHDVARYDMLPNLVAGAGYVRRDNYSGGASRQLDATNGAGSRPDYAAPAGSSYSTSAELGHRLASVEFSWNVLDFGVSYYRAKQKADEFLIAQERKRRVIQTMVHDVRYAFMRSLAAQRLAQEAEQVMKRAELAIEQSRMAESRGAVPVQVSLAYQRALVDAVALLNLRRQDLDFAKAELAALMSAPTTQFSLAEMPETALRPLPADLAVVEDVALMNRPELREEDYRKRISADETRRQLMSAFPNLTFGLGVQQDSNRLLYNNDWIETSTRVSWNLMRVLAAPAIRNAGDRQIEVDDARRQALSMAIMTQTRIAALRYALARSDLDLAHKSMEVDARAAQVARAGVSSRAESELELVRAEARAMVSKYQRAIAHASAHAAYARVQHSIGQDFDFGELDAVSVAEATRRVSAALTKAQTDLPTPLAVTGGQRPKVRLVVNEARTGAALVKGVAQALVRSGFEVVQTDRPDVLALQVSMSMGDAQRGLLQGQVLLAEAGGPALQYNSVLPAQPRDQVFEAIGEAAVTANIGHLRQWVGSRKP